VQRIFAQNCPKKIPKKISSKKTTAFHFMLRAFFQIKALEAFFAQISPK